MAICVSVEINMENMGRLTIVSAQACALEIKLAIVERSGITQSLLWVSKPEYTKCFFARLVPMRD